MCIESLFLQDRFFEIVYKYLLQSNNGISLSFVFLSTHSTHYHYRLVSEAAVVTPTVELNALAMKLGETTEYVNLDLNRLPYNYMYNSPMPVYYPPYRVPPPPPFYHHPYGHLIVTNYFSLSLSLKVFCSLDPVSRNLLATV